MPASCPIGQQLLSTWRAPYLPEPDVQLPPTVAAGTHLTRRAPSRPTDGLESTEHVGGIWVVEAPDLDVVLGWAHKAARALRSLAVEVRPFQHGPDASPR